MVKADEQLVTFHRSAVAVSLTAAAEANAVATFNPRRGIRLSAEAKADVTGRLQAMLGAHPDGASASAVITATAGVSTRLALAAQLDVNGLWAEACAAA